MFEVAYILHYLLMLLVLHLKRPSCRHTYILTFLSVISKVSLAHKGSHYWPGHHASSAGESNSFKEAARGPG